MIREVSGGNDQFSHIGAADFTAASHTEGITFSCKATTRVSACSPNDEFIIRCCREEGFIEEIFYRYLQLGCQLPIPSLHVLMVVFISGFA